MSDQWTEGANGHLDARETDEERDYEGTTSAWVEEGERTGGGGRRVSGQLDYCRLGIATILWRFLLPPNN